MFVKQKVTKSKQNAQKAHFGDLETFSGIQKKIRKNNLYT